MFTTERKRGRGRGRGKEATYTTGRKIRNSGRSGGMSRRVSTSGHGMGTVVGCLERDDGACFGILAGGDGAIMDAVVEVRGATEASNIRSSAPELLVLGQHVVDACFLQEQDSSGNQEEEDVETQEG